MSYTIDSTAPRLNIPRVPLPYAVRNLERVLESEVQRDEEVVILLNHWSRRHIYAFANDPNNASTFTTPLFDFWYDHLIEEGMASGQVVSSAGGGMAFGGASGPAPGTSPQDAMRWQNHVYDYTVKIVTTGFVSGISSALVTLQGGMNLQATDEPVTISTLNVINDIQKSDQTVMISGRVPMRFLRFRWAIIWSDPAPPPTTADIIQQISVRKT